MNGTGRVVKRGICVFLMAARQVGAMGFCVRWFRIEFCKRGCTRFMRA